MKRTEKSFLGIFGEPILYNGNEITGIDELGPSWKDKLPSGSGGSSSPAKFSVSVQDDEIIFMEFAQNASAYTFR